mmetsp:Transcript_41839/g.87852  ORF Transcript_41839/g.87852 Transcript_41839/m.87852 type:complete len:123 (-) Transcript_41839:172-540(-)
MTRSGLAMIHVFNTESGTILVGGADPRCGVSAGGFNASDGNSMMSCKKGGGKTTISYFRVGSGFDRCSYSRSNCSSHSNSHRRSKQFKYGDEVISCGLGFLRFCYSACCLDTCDVTLLAHIL